MRAWRASILGTGLAGCLVAGLAGCASPLAENGDAEATAAFSLPAANQPVPGKPVDNYVRLARLAKACWFVPPALMQSGYVFTAEAKPEQAGGAANIVIYDRTPDGERGLKVFAVSLLPVDGNTALGMKNYRVPEPFGAQMLKDVERWAQGETTCTTASAPWPAAAPDEPETVKPKKAKGKSRKV